MGGCMGEWVGEWVGSGQMTNLIKLNKTYQYNLILFEDL